MTTAPPLDQALAGHPLTLGGGDALRHATALGPVAPTAVARRHHPIRQAAELLAATTEPGGATTVLAYATAALAVVGLGFGFGYGTASGPYLITTLLGVLGAAVLAAGFFADDWLTTQQQVVRQAQLDAIKPYTRIAVTATATAAGDVLVEAVAHHPQRGTGPGGVMGLDPRHGEHNTFHFHATPLAAETYPRQATAAAADRAADWRHQGERVEAHAQAAWEQAATDAAAAEHESRREGDELAARRADAAHTARLIREHPGAEQ